MTELNVENITKVFDGPSGEITAVDDLSLHVGEGEFLVLLGPSGCGKTTTLRMIGGLEEPTAGSIEFDGIHVNDVKARNRDVAMVFQDFALYPHMSVRQNLGFGLRREKNDLGDDEIRSKVEETARMLEIEDLLDKKPADLSGGQKQRVALGRAIVREPRLFLFDEPLANLDAKLRKTMRTEIDELQSRMGITSAYVTHNQEEAMTIADKIAVLRDGELQQLGTPSEVFNEPVNLFVAQFVGSPDMNIFDATLVKQGDSYLVEMSTGSFEIESHHLPEDIDVGEGREVTLGFRPQDLLWEEGGRSSQAGPSIKTDVHVIEPLGTDAIVHGQTPLGDLTATVNRFHELDEHDTVEFTINPEHIYLFEHGTQRLIKGRLNMQSTEVSESGVEA